MNKYDRGYKYGYLMEIYKEKYKINNFRNNALLDTNVVTNFEIIKEEHDVNDKTIYSYEIYDINKYNLCSITLLNLLKLKNLKIKDTYLIYLDSEQEALLLG